MIIEKNAPSVAIPLPKTLSIRHAAAVRDLLLSSFESDGPVVIAIPDEADIDVSFLQIVEAARRHAALHGRSFATASPATDNLLTTLDRAGFLAGIGEDDRAFWFHRKEIK